MLRLTGTSWQPGEGCIYESITLKAGLITHYEASSVNHRGTEALRRLK